MTTLCFIFLTACLVAVLATLLVIKIAWHFGLLDRPDGVRRLHARPTPRLGGIAIFVAFVAPLMAVFWGGHWTMLAGVLRSNIYQFSGLLVGSLLALGLGLLDDIFDLRPLWKILWQVAIATLAYATGFTIEVITNPLGGALVMGVMAYPVTVFWFVACMNAINLLDGMDGVATGTCLFVGLTLFLVCLHAGNWLGMVVMASFSGATLGFLFFNFPPARIFLGDSGSMLLGFLMAATSLVGVTMKATAAVALLVPIVAMGLPILDTLLAIMRRWYHRVPLSSPDRRHIHHVLIGMGYTPRAAVVVLYLVCIVLGSAALLITMGRDEVILLVIGSLAIMAFISIRLFSGLGPVQIIKRLMEDQGRRRQAAVAGMRVEQAVQRMQQAEAVEELWTLCRETLETFEMRYVHLTVEPGAGTEPRSWSIGAPGGGPGCSTEWWTLHVELRHAGRRLGQLQFEHCCADSLRACEIMRVLARLRQGLELHIARLLPAGA